MLRQLRSQKEFLHTQTPGASICATQCGSTQSQRLLQRPNVPTIAVTAQRALPQHWSISVLQITSLNTFHLFRGNYKLCPHFNFNKSCSLFLEPTSRLASGSCLLQNNRKKKKHNELPSICPQSNQSHTRSFELLLKTQWR